jgi:hypothetical protein
VTTGTIDTGTFGTTTSTAATITTGTIPTLVATTLVTTGTGTAAAPAIVPTGDTNTGIFFPAADTIAFSEGGTEGMRIDSSGNVGIGVASPSAKLDVNGVLQLRAVSSEGGQMQLLNTGNASTGLIIDVSTADVGRIFSLRDNFSLQMGQSAGTGGNIQFYTQGTERLRIDSSGQVGIGVTPTTTLDVNGTLQLRGPGSEGGQIDFLNTGNASVGMSIDVSSGSNVGRIITAATNSELKLGQLVGTGGIITAHTAGTERLRIASAGQIGIGGANYGTSGQVLTSAGASAAPSWTTISTTPANGSITPEKLSQPTTFSSTTASGNIVEFTGVPSWVRKIIVAIANASTTSQGSYDLQLGHSGGYETTGYTGISTAITGTNQSSNATLSSSFSAGGQTNGSQTRRGSFELVNVSGNIWQCGGIFSTTPDNHLRIFSGHKTLSGTLDRVRVILGSSDTFDAGNISIMYW